MKEHMNIKEADAICGGLSAPSKMPSFSYNLPASTCPTGKLLRKVEGSVCNSCYACKGRYLFSNVKKALERRYASLDNPLWVNAMTTLIGEKCKAVPFFRFHDSGDIQSDEHLDKIMTVVQDLPKVKFWLPTLEVKTVRDYFSRRRDIGVPKNLNIRISTPMVNMEPLEPVKEFIKLKTGITCSSVYTKGVECNANNICPAIMFKTGNCGSCRKCWDRNVKQVIYLKH
jgi:hypothetical protein